MERGEGIMTRRVRAVVGITAVAVVIVGGGIALAAVANGATDGGSHPAAVPVPSEYTGMNDPALQTCMATRSVCNPAALPELQTLPWTEPLPAAATKVSRAQAERFVRNAIGASADVTTFSASESGAEAVKQFGIDRNSTTDETRPVWVVTVLADVTTDGGPAAAPQVKHAYSAVVDAGSGQITDDCIGCAWLSASR
jgi:hypothetical protein